MRKNLSLWCVSFVTCLIASSCGEGRNTRWEYKTLSTSGIIAAALQRVDQGSASNQMHAAFSTETKNPFVALASIGVQMRSGMDAEILPALERELNALGKDGWELVAHDESVLIFKRRR